MGRHRKPRRFWTERAIARLVRDYADLATWKVARAVKRPLQQVYAKAIGMGLRKSAAYLASPDACRLRRGDNVGAAYRFKPGHVPANKGLRRPGWAPGRMRETQFKKGMRSGKSALNYRPLGSERLVDGYLYVKVAEVPNVAYTVNWKPVHVLNWERANGRAVPDGHCLRFRDGNRLNVGLANLELITRQENGRRNSMHRFPEPIRRAIHAVGALNRRINRMENRNGKNPGRPARAPVRDPRLASRQDEAHGDRAGQGDRRRRTAGDRKRQGGSRLRQGDRRRRSAPARIQRPAAQGRQAGRRRHHTPPQVRRNA